MAKPKLSAEEKRSEYLSFRVTKAEAEQIKEQAEAAGFSQVSDYMRELITAGNHAIELKRAGPMIAAIAKQIGDALAESSLQAIKKQRRGM